MEYTTKERNQHNDVLEYLKTHNGITQLDAYFKFPAPVTRLSAIIFDLKKRGYNIESERISGKNCYGKYSCVMYRLMEE